MDKQALRTSAIAAKEQAYCPISGHSVGAVLLCEEMEFQGANIEIAGLKPSIHAEMMAAFQAIMWVGDCGEWVAMAVTEKPCGMCAHTLAEFVDDEFLILTPDDEFLLGEFLGESYRPGDHE